MYLCRQQSVGGVMKSTTVGVARALLSLVIFLGAHADGAAQTGCSCTDGKVCGTGTLGDPFRCCDLAKDSCDGTSGNNPCKPFRCAVEPSCCLFLLDSCTSDADCGGRAGSCDVGAELCTAPCAPSINGQCGAASKTCQRFEGPAYFVPNGTACDDGRLCSQAVPPPPLVACSAAIGGGNCTRDRAFSDTVDNTGDCPTIARMCSGTGSALGGQGGAITGGRCCPEGTACDIATNQCRGNFGAGANSNDVCRFEGQCSSDTFVGCTPTSDEAGTGASLRASRDGTFVHISWMPACNATAHTAYFGSSPIAGVVNWTSSNCDLGTSGSLLVTVANPPQGKFTYFVVVGRNASSEGSYGKASSGAERPEALATPSCNLPRVLYVCP
jgi:hypothetical protein